MTQLMNEITQQTLHLRFNGRSDEMSLAALGLTPSATDEQIKAALAAHLDCSPAALAGHVVVRHEAAIVVRPEAIYG
jgi:hypothetical protein